MNARKAHNQRQSIRLRCTWGRCLVALLLAVVPLTSGCLTTLALTAVSKSGVADEHIGPVKEGAKDVAEHVAESARTAADQIAKSAEDTFGSLGD